jgi:replicative DNA helicase
MKPGTRSPSPPGRHARHSAESSHLALGSALYNPPMPKAPKRGSRGTDAVLESLIGRIDAASPSSRDSDTIPTGFPSLDRTLGGGLRKQDLVILGGDVGSGKSALGLAMAIRVAGAQIPSMYFSGEMSPDRVLERALAVEGRASIDELRSGRLDEAARASVGAAAVRLRHSPLVVRPLLGANFDELRSALDIVPRRQLLVVDSLQLTSPPRQVSRLQERIALTVRALKSLAIERDLVVLVTAQLPAHRAGRPDPRPTLDDLGGLGAVKQDADVVLLLYREEMYRRDQGVEGATELIVAKNRNGATGFVDLFFYPQGLRFVDMLDAD